MTEKEKELGYTYRELMAVVFARDLQDGWVGVSPAAEVGMAACFLAQKLHAPSLWVLAAQAVNPKPGALYRSGSDFRYTKGAESIFNFYDVFEYSERGVDFIFYSAIQLDKYGNMNLHYVGGDLKRPKLRGPGLANISHAVTAKNYYLYKTTHTVRDFVERVDFISAPGHLSGGTSRAEAGIHMPGPKLCVTPLAVLDFDEVTKAMRLKSVHEGITVEQVKQNTGFELIIPSKVPSTKPPTSAELRILREEIDSTGLLRT